MDITVEDIKKWKQELSLKQVEGRKSLFTLPQGHIGGGWYRISDGCMTNKAGWDQYIEALKKSVKA